MADHRGRVRFGVSLTEALEKKRRELGRDTIVEAIWLLVEFHNARCNWDQMGQIGPKVGPNGPNRSHLPTQLESSTTESLLLLPSYSESVTSTELPLYETVLEKPEIAKPKKPTYPPDFQAFWTAYPTDALMSKKLAYRQWQRLVPDDRALASKAVPGFKRHCEDNTDYRPVHAERFLSQRRFDGFVGDGTVIDLNEKLRRMQQENEEAMRVPRTGAKSA